MEQGTGLSAFKSLDTSNAAAEVQLRAYAAMDGFQRLRVAAAMRTRVMTMLRLRFSDPAELVRHLYRHQLPAAVLHEILDKIRQTSDS